MREKEHAARQFSTKTSLDRDRTVLVGVIDRHDGTNTRNKMGGVPVREKNI